jgi:hypothetical protein
MRNPNRRFILIVVGLLTLALALPVAAQDDALQTACENMWGDWNAETQKCESSVTYSIDIEYPIEYAEYDVVTSAVNTMINTLRDEVLNMRPLVDSPLDPTNGYGMGLSYQSFQHSENVVSLLYTNYINSGGAHPNTYFQSFIFDLDAGTQVTFADLFPDEDAALAVIAPIAQAALTDKFGDSADAEWIEDGAGPELINYRNFVLTEDSVIFYFEPYQVAAYVFGSSEVEIPLTDLADVMAPLE